MQEHLGEFEALGANVVAISVDGLEEARILKAGLRLSFPILSDADTAVSRSYGVFNLLGDRLAAPSVFLLDDEGRVRWRHIGRGAADRPKAEQILEELKQLEL